VKLKINHIFHLLLVCLLSVLFNLYVHVAEPANSMVNYVNKNHPNTENLIVTDGFLPWAVDYHQTLPDFKKRPFTSFLVENVAVFFSVRISIAFVWVNYFFLFCSGFLIYFLAKLYLLSHPKALGSVIFFYFSFSILLAYFIPIATYDEPIQYFLILLSLFFLKKGYKLLFAIIFSFAVISRESSLILLPGIALFLFGIDFKNILKDKKVFLKNVLMLSIPVVIYLAYLYFFYDNNPEILKETKEVLAKKYQIYQRNFRNLKEVSRTLLSFYSVIIFPIFLLFLNSKYYQFIKIDNRLLKAFWLTFLLNSIVIFITVYAEESRVFTLPFLLLFPIFGEILLKSNSLKFFYYLLDFKKVGLVVLTTLLSWFVFNYLYAFTGFEMKDNYYVEYNVVIIFLMIVVGYKAKFLKSLTQNSFNPR